MSDYTTKIAKLMAHANATTNGEEAATFLARAHKLMNEHGISLLDVGRISDDAIDVDIDCYTHSYSMAWANKCLNSLSFYYGCRVSWWKTKSNYTYTVYGRESARITWLLMAPYIVQSVRGIARKAHKAGEYASYTTAQTRVGNALASRIWKLHLNTDYPERKSGGVNALVPVDIIAQMMAQNNITNVKLRRGATDDLAAELAKDVSLSPQMEHKRNALRITK